MLSRSPWYFVFPPQNVCLCWCTLVLTCINSIGPVDIWGTVALIFRKHCQVLQYWVFPRPCIPWFQHWNYLSSQVPAEIVPENWEGIKNHSHFFQRVWNVWTYFDVFCIHQTIISENPKPRVSRNHLAMGAAASWLPGNLESFSSSPSDVPKALRPFLQLRLDPRMT